MASGGQEEPFFTDWPWLSDESSPVTTQKGSAHSCSNFGRKIQNGAPANSYSLTSEPAFLLGLRFPFTVKSKALSYNPTNELRIYFITRYYISDEILTNE